MAGEKIGVDIQPLLPHYDAIVYLGQYNKPCVPVGHSFTLAVVVNKTSRGIVGQDQRFVAADHD